MITERSWTVLVFGAAVWIVAVVLFVKAVARAGKRADELDREAERDRAGYE